MSNTTQNGFRPVRRSAQQGFTPLRRSAQQGFTSSKRSAQQGFTLVELMVALLVFGLIASAGVALLSFSVRAQSATSAKLDDVAAVSRLSAALTADMAQATLRPVRDRGGQPDAPFIGGSSGTADPVLRLSRGGWSNPDGARRPNVQKVEYRLSGDVIERIAYPMLDGSAPLPTAPILSGVRQLAVRYRYQGAWSDFWSGSSAAPLPDAVEWQVTRSDGTQYRLLMLVGTGYGGALREGGNASP